MVIQFPNTPTNGQVYSGYYYDSTLNAWKASPVGAGPASISDTAPSGAIHGDMWYNSADGTMYIYVNDGTSSQWVEIHSNTAASPGSIIQVVSSVSTNTLSGTLGGASNPTSTDGTQFHTFSFTPKLSNSKLLIQSSNIIIGEYANTSDEFYMAAYYDTTRMAIVGATPQYASFANSYGYATHAFNHMSDSWGTTTKTVQIRVGSTASNVGSLYVNQNYMYNGFASGIRNVSFTIMEVAQ